MNKEDSNKIHRVSQKYKNIVICVTDWIELALQEPVEWLNSTSRNDICKGLYGTIGLCKCYVSPIVANGFIRVSNHEEPSVRAKDKAYNWSPEILIKNLDDIDRIMRLKAFWWKKMNKIEKDNLLSLTTKYKNICININDFVDMMKRPWDGSFDPITEKKRSYDRIVRYIICN